MVYENQPVPAQERSPWETKAFFEQDPRSKKLREATIIALSLAQDLIENNGKNVGAGIFQLNALKQATEKLVELGVLVDMHEELPGPELNKDPLLTAEYIAGKLLKMIVDLLKTSREAIEAENGGNRENEFLERVAQKFGELADGIDEATIVNIRYWLDVGE